MDDAIAVADSAMDTVDAIDEQVCLQVHCNPVMDTDLEVLSLEGDSPSVVAVAGTPGKPAHATTFESCLKS
jgi:hypothetical protein